MSKSVDSLLSVIALVLLAMLSTVPVSAQKAPLPLGTIDPHAIHKLHSCPVGYYVGMSCFSGQVENCPNTATIGFTYGVESFGGSNAGTVVFLVGGGGQTAFQ